MPTTYITAPTIIADIDKAIIDRGLPNSSWYVGITSDIDQRLFIDHKVPRNGGDMWIWKRAVDHTTARQIERAYHQAGCQGSHGGGDHTAVYIYAYVITGQTLE